MTAYAGGVGVWQIDATPVYGPLAAHLLAAHLIEVSGRRVLDAGAGSGVAGDQLRARGADVISADVEPDMVAHLAGKGPALLADIRSLPLPDGDVDLAVAAFVVNHLPEPAAGLAELGRVTSRGGWVLASVFGNDRAPAKAAVDQVAARFGFEPPAWYGELQRAGATVGTVDGMVAAARRAGLEPVLVDEQAVDLGALTPTEIVRYRLALPQLRSFVAGLGVADRTELRSAATAAVESTGVPFEPVVIRLAARPHRVTRSTLAGQSSRVATAARSRSPRSPEATIKRSASSLADCRAAAEPVAA